MNFTPAQLASRGRPKELLPADSRDHLIKRLVEDERAASEAKTTKLREQRLARERNGAEIEKLQNDAALLRDRELVRDLITALSGSPKGLRRWAVMRAIRQRREKANVSIPQKLEDAVERAFLHSCENAEAFKKRNCPPETAIFFWPQGKAGGIWAVHAERARDWLASEDSKGGGAG